MPWPRSWGEAAHRRRRTSDADFVHAVADGLSESQQTVTEVGLARPGRHVEQLRYLPVGVAVEVGQLDRLPLAPGQPGKARSDLGLLLTQDDLLGRPIEGSLLVSDTHPSCPFA